MAEMISFGPAANPILHPVIEYVLETPWAMIVLSLKALSIDAMLVCL